MRIARGHFVFKLGVAEWGVCASWVEWFLGVNCDCGCIGYPDSHPSGLFVCFIGGSALMIWPYPFYPASSLDVSTSLDPTRIKRMCHYASEDNLNSTHNPSRDTNFDVRDEIESRLGSLLGTSVVTLRGRSVCLWGVCPLVRYPFYDEHR